MTKSAGPALHRLHQQFADRVRFVTLYVREAHPGDDYPQPATLEQKIAHARDYAARDRISWTVAVDDVEGSLHRTLDPKPHAAYLVGPDATVVWRSLWANDETVVRDALQAVASGQAPSPAQRQPRLRPMLRGTGEMWSAWTLAGGHAKTDVLKEAPPLFASARVAQTARPLPPLLRGAVGMAVTMAVPVVVAAALARRRDNRERK